MHITRKGLACVVGLVFQLAAFAGEGAPEDHPKQAGVSGGLCLYLDCGDGHAMADIARGGKFLVHGLAADANAIPGVRRYLAKEGLAELTTVEPLSPTVLPYEKNHVNLIVAENLPALVGKGLTLEEIVRVLAPYGGACLGMPKDQEAQMKKQLEACGIAESRFVAGSRNWLVFNKPRPKEMDDWTQYFHAADGNPVSRDTYFGGPNQLQWITGPGLGPMNTVYADMGPLAPASYEEGAKDNDPIFMLSARGRVFCYYRNKKIVARDAFSGALLWIKTDFLQTPVSSSTQVAAGDDVICINTSREVVALSGATGEVVRSFGKVTEYTTLMYDQGVLLAFESGRLTAMSVSTGQKIWSSTNGNCLAP